MELIADGQSEKNPNSTISIIKYLKINSLEQLERALVLPTQAKRIDLALESAT